MMKILLPKIKNSFQVKRHSALLEVHKSRNNFLVLIILLSMMFAVSSCQKATYQNVYPTLSDGRYDSEFPYRNCSSELDAISKSVKKLYCLVEYDRYDFYEKDALITKNLTNNSYKKLAFNKDFFSESVHGSATIIYNQNGKVAVLTCAHIIDYPDTIISYFVDGSNQKTEIIQSISLKRKQLNFIRDLPGDGVLQVIVADNDLDVAFLGNYFDNVSENIKVFNYPAGNADKLEWGSFVYIMGYPAGYQMVTRGIVSNPNTGKKGEFLLDALFNNGISGGIVLAVKDGVPNFELVGIAKTVSAKYKNVLKPEKDSYQEIFNPNIPYTGNLYIKLEKDINYGVTFAASIEAIGDIYFKNKAEFTRQGFFLDNFFETKK
jgi:hypothetical protein